ncbi:hypothetical protein PMAYCL1PPCAC_21016 [Pristionchus mayeri]|uniref:WD40 domain-containing protein n=1 Tax=Pristionchus mayeri TaxID=1317129 RepID=A0AAN5I4W0_9BILA|nr:hypothetical protein PMAYCL1PPCAC_21016 [Pristionchus mayeri]
MKITTGNIGEMQCAKEFSEHKMRVNSLNYSNDGMHMISSSDDESIVLYNCDTGIKTRTLNSKKYGVDLIHFSHKVTDAIHCSTKIDDTIRYLSLHDNKYIRYFSGHQKKVITLAMSPIDDTFISSSLDKSIRLWDLKSPNCQGLMQLQHKAVAAFDPEGLIFAAGVNSEHIKLYDLRSYDKGPFTTFQLEQEAHCEWTSMKFSPNGKQILMCTNGEHMKLVDAFTGNILYELKGHKNVKRHALEASFSPDSNFVFCPSSDLKIYSWSTETGTIAATLNTNHTSFFQQVAFNPRYYVLASACSNVCFWVPSEDE